MNARQLRLYLCANACKRMGFFCTGRVGGGGGVHLGMGRRGAWLSVLYMHRDQVFQLYSLTGGVGVGDFRYTQRGPSFHMYMCEQWPPHLCYNAT